jgi:hypothetical protein
MLQAARGRREGGTATATTEPAGPDSRPSPRAKLTSRPVRNGIDDRPDCGFPDAAWPDRLWGMTAPAQRVLIVAEPDYCFGRGPLKIRVERIDRTHPVWRDSENWYQVEGTQPASDGDEIGHRQVLVRGRRLAPS